MFDFFRSLWTCLMALIIAFLGLFGYKPATPATEAKTDFDKCKNVVFLIGDGMGFNSLEKTRYDCNVALDSFNSFPYSGESMTHSANKAVTDSAAGGTALATATKTKNYFVGTFPNDGFNLSSHPVSLTELAVSQGKLAGIVTTDLTTGATPASFSAHTHNRGDEKIINRQQLESELTVCWGAETPSFKEDSAVSNGFTVIRDKASMDALEEGSRSFGQFSDSTWHNYDYNGMPTLTQMTAKAIDLLDDDEDGFFLMVEAAHIDKNSHSNDGEGMVDAVQSFDKTLAYVLDYAKKDGDTLVIVTADHETGGITFTDGQYVYTTTDHTGANVPLYVYGCDNFMQDGEVMENIEVSRRVACVMGEENFPIKEKASFIQSIRSVFRRK